MTSSAQEFDDATIERIALAVARVQEKKLEQREQEKKLKQAQLHAKWEAGQREWSEREAKKTNCQHFTDCFCGFFFRTGLGWMLMILAIIGIYMLVCFLVPICPQ
jgi:hypothetical protein